MYDYVLSFDYTGKPPTQSFMNGYVTDVFASAEAVSIVIWKVTTSLSSASAVASQFKMPKNYTGGKLTSVEVTSEDDSGDSD